MKFRVFIPLLYFTILNLQELRKREEMIAKKEALLSERSELEMKKLRSSQVVNKVIYYYLSFFFFLFFSRRFLTNDYQLL